MLLGLATELGQRHADLLLLLLGLGLLYVSSRSAVDALVGRDEDAPGWRAVGHHVPIAAVALAGTWLHQPALAIGVLFGASVASLSLGCGTVAVTSEHRIEAPPAWRRVWPFVIVVAVLSLLAGFAGMLTLWHAGMFFAEGIVLWLLWHDRGGDQIPPPAGRRVRPILLLLAIVLAGVGAWAASRGAVDLGKGERAVTLGTVAATMTGPLLVLPMLGTGANLANRGKGGVAVTSHVGVVLLNLCLWLPVVIGGTYWQDSLAASAPTAAATQPATQAASQPSNEDAGTMLPEPELVFPIVVWRVDTIVLLVLGLILLPAAIGRWTLGRRDGMIMLVVYVAYLMVVAAAGRR